MVSYMIVLTYKLVNLFGNYNVNFAAAFMPVFLFALTIISFFLFVREVFIRNDEKNKRRGNIIALISTFFMIVIPVFLPRTVAGIPEKESVAFFFMFLALFIYLKAWKSNNLKKAILLGILAGIATALMGLTWGGVNYLFVTIAVANFGAFILNKVGKKEFLIYSLWIIFAWVIMLLFSERFSLIGFLKSLDTGLASLVFFIIMAHFILWKIKLKNINAFEKINLPKNVISLIIAIIFAIVFVSAFFGPNFIIEKVKAVNQILFKPVTGRWSVTVAENRQPYFTEWGASFGPFIKNVPILFWLFFIGSVVLFKDMLKTIRKKDSWVITFFYILFFFGLVFSRYSSSSIFNGENFISKAFYYSSAAILLASLVYYYVKYYKEKERGFEKIDFEFLLLFSLFTLCLFTARSAVRLIMVLGPIAPIFVGYLNVFLFDKFKKTKDETWKIIVGMIFILVLFLSLFIFWNFYKQVKVQAYNYVPSYYNYQWQKAMAWVRENTPENAVFGHWWDYGYWLQSIGNRATVLDGGNVISLWNYYMGRLVLTGDNEKDALEFLYAHNTTHFLIDSSDIGKYGAFSSIGSDENYDRYSWIPTMLSDQRQIRETRNGTIRIYQGGSILDEDIIWKEKEKEIFLPANKAAIIGLKIEYSQKGDKILFKQPIAIFYYQGFQHQIPLRYVYYNEEFIDFNKGLGATIYIIPKVYQTGQSIQVDNLGALIYISPRVMRGFLAQKYLLNDPFNNFPHFELIHTEPNLIIDSLNSQGLNLNEFIYFNGIMGPIKIWKINYTGEEKIKQKYLDTDPSKYISWNL